MMYYKLVNVLIVFCVLQISLFARSENHFQYDESAYEQEQNMCYRNVTYTVTVTVTKMKLTRVATTVWVPEKFPPWVQDVQLQRNQIVVPQVLTMSRVVGECCEGYNLSKQNKCEPTCSSNCAENECVSPNVCNRCKLGFAKPLCDICADGYTSTENGGCDPLCSEHCISPDQCMGPDQCASCKTGYVGHLCKRVCPQGYYTANCNVSCNCSMNGYFECDPTDGCICRNGYQGSNCDIPVVLQHIQHSDVKESHEFLFTPIILIIFTIIILMIIVYYKRKVSLLKEINQRSIDDNESVSTSSNYIKNFFNPMYSNVQSFMKPSNRTNNNAYVFYVKEDSSNETIKLPKKVNNVQIHLNNSIEKSQLNHVNEKFRK